MAVEALHWASLASENQTGWGSHLHKAVNPPEAQAGSRGRPRRLASQPLSRPEVFQSDKSEKGEAAQLCLHVRPPRSGPQGPAASLPSRAGSGCHLPRPRACSAAEPPDPQALRPHLSSGCLSEAGAAAHSHVLQVAQAAACPTHPKHWLILGSCFGRSTFEREPP